VGVIGQLFKELAFTVTWSNLASLFVSLTLTALLASWVRSRRASGGSGVSPLAHPAAPGRAGFSPIRAQQALVRWFLDHRGIGIVAVLALFLASLGVTGALGREFLPKVDQGQFIMQLELLPGARLKTTDAVARRLEERLFQHSAVQDVTVNLGSSEERKAEGLIETLGPHQGRILVGLKSRPQRTQSTSEVIQEIMSLVKGISLEGGAQLTYLAQESSFQSTFLVNAPLVVEVRGEAWPILESLAKRVERELASTRGSTACARVSSLPPRNSRSVSSRIAPPRTISRSATSR